jgi:alkanesulfonate monooxygenase SsuD/methylene tetrahydromethanopterin reductase-like flavin-dependent oxidoreductase (luciferase family)
MFLEERMTKTSRKVEFGIFDHVERTGQPIADRYEETFRLLELYERLGFHAFFKSEHHCTALSVAPSPVPFLAAASQRTTTLRIGTLVFTLALHDPLRLAEDICALDHLTRGRLEVGLGRGANLVEQGFFGRDPNTTRELYDEAVQAVLQGLRENRIDFHGKFFNYNNVPLEVEPLQKPTPPLWLGVVEPRHVVWAVENDAHAVFHGPNAKARANLEAYKAQWTALGKSPEERPHLGILRQLVIAETDAEALETAERTYLVGEHNHMHIWRSNNVVDPYNPNGMAKSLGDARQNRRSFAGSPSTMRDELRREMRETGADYFVMFPNFGDMTFEESKRTAELFAREVAPALAEEQLAAA